MGNINWIGLKALAMREMLRTFRVVNQVIWPPLISTALYLFVFGLSLGSRIQTIEGIPYAIFLIPGLILMNVIDSAYGESSSSLFQGRFMNSIQDVLTAPLSPWEIVSGFLAGSLLRGLLIGNLILLLAGSVTGTWPSSPLLYFFWMTLVCVLFSCIGLIMGLVGDKWDHMAILTTFFITPLVFLGGVFTPVSFLPVHLQPIAQLNPLFYLIDGFRFTVLGHSEMAFGTSLAVALCMTAIFLIAALTLFQKGYKLRV